MKPARVFLPAVLSGLLLWAAFFPLDLGFLAFVALVPFLTLVRAEGIGPWRRYAAAFLGGLVFYGIAMNWVRVAHPTMALFAWPGGTVYCALYWPLALLLLRKLDRLRLPFALTLPVVWVGLEYVRAHFPTGFPFLSHIGAHQLVGFGWYDLGYALHDVTPLTQAADLGGVYLVSLAVAAVNGAIYDTALAVGRAACPSALRTRELVPTALAYLFPLALTAYGFVRLDHPPFEVGPRVAAVQGNLSQNMKELRGDQKPEDAALSPLEREYLPLAEQAGRLTPRPDLVIWPETCWPDNWFDARPGVPDDPDIGGVERRVASYQRRVGAKSSDLHRTHALLGLNTEEWGGDRWRKYNSAVLIGADGRPAGRYDKIHLVPFGEYVPLRQQFPWLQSLTPYTHDYSCTPGENWTRFELPTARGAFHFGVLICYEDSDPSLARRYNPASGHGPGVDFLVNISNDGWFDGTEEHEEHLAICRFRAIESRRSVVRAVNMGISAVIDPDGRVIALPAEGSWSNSKKVRGVVAADVPIDRRETVYAAVGDWVPGLCWAVVLLGLVRARFRPAPSVTA